jgi:hypothetical protein
LLHAHAALGRLRWWEAHYWINSALEKVFALACLRLGLPASHAKGVHLLPAEMTEALRATLVRDLAEAELRRALVAVADAYLDEVTRTDTTLAMCLEPLRRELDF